jgi:hypothetical protein
MTPFAIILSNSEAGEMALFVCALIDMARMEVKMITKIFFIVLPY